MTKPIDTLKTIARYVEAKKPKTLAEAEHMLDLISVMADETIFHEDAAKSPLAKRLISEPFSHRSSHGHLPLALAVARRPSCSPAMRPGDPCQVI